MKYKIISTDFDGTLLTNEKKITNITKKAILECKNNNYITIGITARNLSSVKNILDIKMFNYLILNNGCYIYDVEKNKGKYIKNIDRETVIKITNNFKSIAQGIDYISAEKYYMYRNKGTIDSRSFVKKINGAEEVQDSIARMNVMPYTLEEVQEYKNYIDNNFEKVESILMQDTDKKTNKKWVAINPKGINKFTTLKQLCNELNISTDEVIFFGDSTNDLVIIQNVGLGVAMGNALPQVKEKAKEIALSNNENGVAVFLEKLSITFENVPKISKH